jgi:hypothetical protein
MRLLDLIVQSTDPFIVVPHEHGSPMTVNGPRDFARSVADCPLRFVITEDLTRACAELAFAEGDRLASCLDLLRIPAPSLWVEWSDTVHQQVISQCGTVAQSDPNALGRQVGVLLQARPDGRSGMARTFWSAPADAGSEALLSPLETHINFDASYEPVGRVGGMLRGQYVSLTDRDSGVADLLERVRFRCDESWLKYYDIAAPDLQTQESVARSSLASVACDVPMLMAFFLLLSATGATRGVPVHRDLLNRKRQARGRPALLDHIEVHACLPEHSNGAQQSAESGAHSRRAPRLHHVRGHLVRREDRVFWRTPHLRGSARQGVVRSRTVCLSFSRTGASAPAFSP